MGILCAAIEPGVDFATPKFMECYWAHGPAKLHGFSPATTSQSAIVFEAATASA